MAFDLNSITELFSAQGSPRATVLTDWMESIHHAAIYTDYLIIVPDGDTDERAHVALNLSRLHGETFESAFQHADAALSWSDVLLLMEQALQIEEPGKDLLQRSEFILSVAHKRFSANGSLMVVLDNCQQLSGDTLNQIAHFALLAQHRVVFALFGSPGFDTLIRESPAHAMKQYLLRPDPGIKPEVVVHGAWLIRLEKHYRQHIDSLKSRSKAFRNIVQPMENGRFPLTHIVVITLLVIAIVVVAMSGDSFESSDQHTGEANHSEVILPDRGRPALVSSLSTSEVEKFVDHEMKQPLASGSSVLPPTEVVSPRNHPDPIKPQALVIPDKKIFPLTPDAPSADKKPVAVIQLLGVRDETAVIAFLDKWASQTSLLLGYFESDLKGQPWFVVVAGRFTDKESARKAIHTLPEDLRAGSPWVREIDPSLIQP